MKMQSRSEFETSRSLNTCRHERGLDVGQKSPPGTIAADRFGLPRERCVFPSGKNTVRSLCTAQSSPCYPVPTPYTPDSRGLL